MVLTFSLSHLIGGLDAVFVRLISNSDDALIGLFEALIFFDHLFQVPRSVCGTLAASAGASSPDFFPSIDSLKH